MGVSRQSVHVEDGQTEKDLISFLTSTQVTLCRSQAEENKLVLQRGEQRLPIHMIVKAFYRSNNVNF